MIYLLGQILLCLVLAALAGWFVGWSWRGFREQDRAEDLRNTLRATEEVKDRDLSESQRREDALRSRVEVLERRCERLADELSAARRSEEPERLADETPAASVVVAADGEPAQRGGSPSAEDNGDGDLVPAPFSLEVAEVQALRDKLGRLEEELELERQRGQEAASALRDKTSAVLALQAEIQGLRSGTEERAEQIARLERRLVELEPLEERLGRREAELRDLEARLHDEARERGSDAERARDLDHRGAVLEEQLRERDRRLNELRNDYNDAVARLEGLEADRERLRTRLREGDGESEEAIRYRAIAAGAPQLQERLEDCSRRLQQVEGQLEEARSALQRQLERNRKQEAVHQQVVANLREELRERGGGAGRPPAAAPAAGGTEEARWRQLVAHRDSSIAGLRSRILELEEGLPQPGPEPDDLKKIRGIGPKLERTLHSLGVTRFAQIARWDDEDIERVGEHLGAFKARIQREDWVRNARRQHLLKYGREPSAGE